MSDGLASWHEAMARGLDVSHTEVGNICRVGSFREDSIAGTADPDPGVAPEFSTLGFPANDLPMIVGATKLCEVFGVDRRTVTNWINSDPPCPSMMQGKERRFDTAAVAKWLQAREARNAVAQIRRDEPADFEEAKARKMAAEARLAEIQLEREEARILYVEENEERRERELLRLRATLLAIPGRFAPTTVGCKTIPESLMRWEAAIREAMQALSELGDEDDGADEAERAA